MGLAALAQAGAIFMLFGVVAYLLYVLRPRLGSALAIVAPAAAAFALVIAPWMAYSTDRFGRLVVLANDNSTVVSGANCASTYGGALLGYWDYACLDTLRPGADQLDEVQFGAIIRREGLAYARGHPGRLPAVGLARLGRVWGVFHPVKADFGTRTGRVLAWLAYVMVAIAALAMGWRRRRDRPASLIWFVIVTTSLAAGRIRESSLPAPS